MALAAAQALAKGPYHWRRRFRSPDGLSEALRGGNKLVRGGERCTVSRLLGRFAVAEQHVHSFLLIWAQLRVHFRLLRWLQSHMAARHASAAICISRFRPMFTPPVILSCVSVRTHS